MFVRIDVNRSALVGNWSELQRVLGEFCDELRGRYGSLAPIEHTNGRRFMSHDGDLIARMQVFDGTAEAEGMPRPKWLDEIVLSMEHDHSPLVRAYGTRIRISMEGK